jgi:murein L,D-transpeptidase YcbB/YkuD
MKPILLILPFLLAPLPLVAQEISAGSIGPLIATGHHVWSRRPDFGSYAADLSRLYLTNDSRLIWHDGPRLSPAASAAIAQLSTAGDWGLDPADYDAALLDSLERESSVHLLVSATRDSFDLLLSIDVLRYVDDLHRGRLHPNPLGDRGSEMAKLDLVAALGQAIRADTLPQLIAALQPRLIQYRSLLAALARYRGLAGDSALLPLQATTTVHPGDPYPGITALARRLIAFGDLAANDTPPDSLYLGPIVEAVTRFQTRHGLKPDGVVGPATLTRLRTPLQWRVRQIELALERLRWLPPLEGDRVLVVNIPGFELFAFDSAGRSGTPSLEMKVIVGRAIDRRTPVLLEQLRYVEFWPWWNVPRRIAVEEVLPQLERKPDYLRVNGMELVGPGNKALGDRVTPVVLRQLRRGQLAIRQQPGPANPLGLIKFGFPNATQVYLHGTPSPELFSRTRRDFSHGCIRVEDPSALANWVMRDEPGWQPDSTAAGIQGPETRRIWLRHPLQLAIFYTTAVVRPDGTTWFYDDIYGQDRSLDEALRNRAGSPL